MAITVPSEKQSITNARDALYERYEICLFEEISNAINARMPNFGALTSKAKGRRHEARERKRLMRARNAVGRWLLTNMQAIRSQNTFIIGSEHIPPLPTSKAQPRSTSRAAHTAATDTDSGGGGPDDPDPDPDPQRPYIALGIDHKATTPAGPPVLAVLRPFTDLNAVTARLCRYETRQPHTGPQGSDSSPP